MMRFTDVTLRDGLQMEAKTVPLEAKLVLLEKLLALPAERIELTSFVNPKWIPQLADATVFCEAVFNTPSRFGASFKDKEWMAFVPNERGLQSLLAFDIPWVSAFVAASETFNKKNVNADIASTLSELSRLVTAARARNRKIRIYISTVFGCPYEGALPTAAVQSVLRQVAALQPDEIALSDTIGVAVPQPVKEMVGALAAVFPIGQIALHLHNTYGLAIAAAIAGFEAGIRHFDGSTGGIGGCPYAKGATGNVALEQLVYLFHRLGECPQWQSEKVWAATSYVESLGIKVPSPIHEILKKGGKLYGVQ